MQDQGTTSQSTLQQPRTDLQQNSANLQQSGSPTTSADISTVLSEAAPQGQLQVSTATTPTPSTVAPSTVHSGGHGALLWLLLIPLIFIVVILLPNRAVYEPVPEVTEEPVPPAPTPAKVTKKTKKKSAKRKKSSKR